jgi:hypothetical protein
MRVFNLRSVLAMAVILGWAATAAVAEDAMLAPKDLVLSPGVTEVHYGGQTFRFETPQPLYLHLEPAGTNRIRVRFECHECGQAGGAASAGVEMQFYWENFDEIVYSGPPPKDGWEGILNTESGFTEK